MPLKLILMALNLNLISASVKQYGTPLFQLEETIGTFDANTADVTVVDEHTFMFQGYYVRLRNKAIEDGHTTASDREWTMGQFVSTRDYEFNGTTYPAGRQVLMAF
jgi:hypothetical protein